MNKHGRACWQGNTTSLRVANRGSRSNQESTETILKNNDAQKRKFLKSSKLIFQYLEYSRRVFVVQRGRRLPSDVALVLVDVGVTDNDELEGKARLVEAGVRAQVVELDVHLEREHEFDSIKKDEHIRTNI